MLSLLLMAGFQNCSPIKASDSSASLVGAAQDGSGTIPDGGSPITDGGGNGGSMNGSNDGPSPSIPAPGSLSDAVAMCANGVGLKSNANVIGSQSGSQMSFIITADMNVVGSLSDGVRVLMGGSVIPSINSIGSTSNSLLVLCNLDVKHLGSLSASRLVLVNTKVEHLGSWSNSIIYYDSASIVGDVGSQSGSSVQLK